MKKLLSKIRNKRLKGNISLLVILILLASSVISLLSINQIQRLLTYGNMTFNYFRAFYLAKAGTELGLTEVYNSGDGFNYEILSGSTIVTGNLLSEYDGFEPYFRMNVSGSFLYLTEDIRKSTECADDNKIKLAPGEGIMLSLFSDKTSILPEILSDDKNLFRLDDISDLSLDTSDELTFALFVYDDEDDEQMKDIVVDKKNSLGSFFEEDNVKKLLNDKSTDKSTKKYLTIKNSSSKDVEFCVYKGGTLIPYSDSLITVFGHYGDMEVGLQSIVKKGVPDWTLNVLGE